jgi:hypothetical protein
MFPDIGFLPIFRIIFGPSLYPSDKKPPLNTKAGGDSKTTKR